MVQSIHAYSHHHVPAFPITVSKTHITGSPMMTPSIALLTMYGYDLGLDYSKIYSLSKLLRSFIDLPGSDRPVQDEYECGNLRIYRKERKV